MNATRGEGVGSESVTVLLVDDEFDTRFVVRLLLEAEGLGVVEAFNGADAIDYLTTGSVDVVVTDIDMPGMDGPALVAALRGDPATAGLPILAWGEREPHGLDVDVTLAKGAGVRQLVDEVNRLLGRSA